MPTVARELSIKYGLITAGGASDKYLLTGKYIHDETYDRSIFTFNVIVTSAPDSTEASFKLNVEDLEKEFRKPRQDFKIVQGAVTLIDFKHADNTGYSAVPSCVKVADEMDTGRSREYQCTVEMERPADLVGQSGRRESRVTLNPEPNGRLLLTVEGTYTALGGLSARANYDASIGAYISALQSALGPGSTWQKLTESATSDDPDKNLEFRQTFEEVDPADDADSGLDNFTLTLSRQVPAPGDSYGTPGKSPSRFIIIQAAVTGQGPVDEPFTNWTTKTKPWILKRVQTVFQTGALSIVDETFAPELKTGNINGSLTIFTRNQSNLVEYNLTEDISATSGNAIVPVWDGPIDAHVFREPRVILRRVTERERWIGGIADVPGARGGRGFRVGIDIGNVGIRVTQPGGGGGPTFASGIDIGGVGVQFGGGGAGGGAGAGGGGSDLPSGGDWIPISVDSQKTPLELGVPGNSIKVVDIVTVITAQWVKRVKGVIETGAGR